MPSLFLERLKERERAGARAIAGSRPILLPPLRSIPWARLSHILNLHLRQPIGTQHEGLNIEALLDVNNMLAEGYRPYLVNGSMLVFAQDQRSIGAGVAFTF